MDAESQTNNQPRYSLLAGNSRPVLGEVVHLGVLPWRTTAANEQCGPQAGLVGGWSARASAEGCREARAGMSVKR